MKKTPPILFALLMLHSFCFAQSVFQKIINETYTWGGGYVLPNPDGTCWVACMKVPPYPDNVNKLWIVKLDANGVALSGNVVMEKGEFIVKGMEPTRDGGFVVTGTQSQFTYNPFLAKFNARGDKEWVQFYKDPKAKQWGHSAQQTADGGYIICGSTYRQSSDGNALLIKTDAQGNWLWDRVVEEAHVGFSVATCTDGGYICAGQTNKYDSQGDTYILKTNVAGEKTWSSTFKNTGPDYGITVKQAIDGGFVITGNEQNATTDIGLYKMDASGKKLWEKTFGGGMNDQARSLDMAPDGSIVVAGFTQSFKPGTDDREYFLIKTDAQGNERWHKIHGGIGDDYCQSVRICADGGCLLGGYSNKNNDGANGIFIAKTDASGN